MGRDGQWILVMVRFFNPGGIVVVGTKDGDEEAMRCGDA